MSKTTDLGTLELVEGLRERRRVLGKRLERVSQDRQHTASPLSPDFEEQAVERENDEVLDALDEREHAELEHIDRALARVDVGCFGICDTCGADIDPLRLEATPAAEFCLPCAEAAEAAR